MSHGHSGQRFLNSALTMKTEARSEGSYLDVQVAKNNFEAQVRAGGYVKKKITAGTNMQLYNLHITPVYSIYRRYKITENKEFIININTGGVLSIQPLGKDLEAGDAVNFSEKFFITT